MEVQIAPCHGAIFGGKACLGMPDDTVPQNGLTIWVVDSGWPKEACITLGAHWRNLANTIESSMCGGYAAFLSNYFDHLLKLLRYQ